MAILIPLGFESGDNSEWHNWGLSGTAVIQSTTVKTGTYAGKIITPSSATPTGWVTQFSSSAPNETWASFYLYIHTRPNARTTIADYHSTTSFTNTTSQGNIELNTDGTLTLMNFVSGARSQIGSASAPLTNDTWNLVEIYEEQANAHNTITAKLNGTTFADSGVGGSDVVGNAVALRVGANIHSETCSSGEWYFDDILVVDQTGASSSAVNNMNTWPGEHAIVHLHPNGAGDFAEGAAGGSAPAATGWESVKVVSPIAVDGVSYWQFQTDTSSNATSPDRLDVTCEDFTPSASSIICVAVVGRVRGATSTSCSWTARIKSQASGTLQEDTATVPTIASTTWFNNDDTANIRQPKLFKYKDPQNTSNNWTVPLLNSMQIGARAPDASPDLWLGQLFAVVIYVPSAPSGKMMPILPRPLRYWNIRG